MKITMTKALEILDLNLVEAGPKMPPDVKAAVALGCQGLRRIKLWRRVYFPILQELLIGEESEASLEALAQKHSEGQP
jgi:hypothetical protein